MWNDDAHVSDQDLLRAVDGELSGGDASRIQAHLEACWKCRSRRVELDRTIGNFMRAYSRETEEGLPPIEGPRSVLRARLRQLQCAEPPSVWQLVRQFIFSTRGPAYFGLGFGAICLIGLVLYLSVEQVRAESVPDSSLTPGATRTVEREEVCSSQPEEGFYPIPTTLAYRVFEKYRIRKPRPRSYEVDYLITPALGGADDIRNLWPQPYESGEWNAHIKDALEDYLHKQVCSGQLDLQAAQRDIAANWIDAYQKYFQTDRPLPIHTDFSIDAPWEE